MKAILRSAVPALTGFISNTYPQIVRSGTKNQDFGNPEMIISDLWEDVSDYKGRDDLLNDAKYLIEELNPIKPEILSSAKVSMKSKQKTTKDTDNWIVEKDLMKLRNEMHNLLLSNNGYLPDESDPELFKRYNNILARIRRLEEEKPNILADIDSEFREIVKNGLNE